MASRFFIERARLRDHPFAMKHCVEWVMRAFDVFTNTSGQSGLGTNGQKSHNHADQQGIHTS